MLASQVFAHQTKLTTLHLHENKLKELPASIFSLCVELMELRVDNNKIKEFHKDLFIKNKKFKILNMMDNPIKAFDAYFLPTSMELLYIGEKINYRE